MGHEWILDVLADLRAYAAQNGLLTLAAKTDEALRTARAELASRAQPPPEPRTGPPG
jgi:hypothetical protein